LCIYQLSILTTIYPHSICRNFRMICWAMNRYLYKVSQPRTNLVFHPSTFWHTLDWESSTTRYRDDYIEDKVLYVGDFDEVNIHLFPRERTVRVRAIDANHSALEGCGMLCSPGKTAYIFCATSCKREVELFRPTIFIFNSDGFTRVRKGEYVSWVPQKAVSAETMSIAEAVNKWNIQVCHIADLNALIATLTRETIYFDEQT
jgi:hypothetical protein